MADDRSSRRDRGPTERVLRAVGTDVIERLRALPGSDLTTLLLEVMRGRAEMVTAADVLRQHERDRFVAPVPVPFDRMRETETAILSALPEGTETVVLSPVVPLGTHRAVAPIDPRWTIPTIRGTEVAADPTNGLALVAATRRRDLVRRGRVDEVVRLAASQRIVRAQDFGDAEAAFAHFQIIGLVTAGRDAGGHRFERDAISEHVRFLAKAFAGSGARDVRLGVTDLTGDGRTGVGAAARAAAADAAIDVVDEPDRERGRRYYRGVCFQMYARLGDGNESIADGGFVDWIARLTASRKERLCISGVGLERLTLASSLAE
jgi:hypothetical protein